MTPHEELMQIYDESKGDYTRKIGDTICHIIRPRISEEENQRRIKSLLDTCQRIANN